MVLRLSEDLVEECDLFKSLCVKCEVPSQLRNGEFSFQVCRSNEGLTSSSGSESTESSVWNKGFLIESSWGGFVYQAFQVVYRYEERGHWA